MDREPVDGFLEPALLQSLELAAFAFLAV